MERRREAERHMSDLYESAKSAMEAMQFGDGLQACDCEVSCKHDRHNAAVHTLRVLAPDLARAYIAQHEARAKDEARVKAAYLAGFNASAEGWNGEYPYSDTNLSPEDDTDWIECRDAALAAMQEGDG
mgnify:FL=1